MSTGLENLCTRRAGRDSSRVAASRKAALSRESGCLPPQRNPYASRGELAPPCAPGPRLRHAASVEAWLGKARAFSTPYRAPSSDEDSARGSSTRRINEGRSPVDASSRSARHGFYDRSARGLMCRELHEAFFLRIDVERNTKSARTILFLFHLLPTRLSTGCPRRRVFGGFRALFVLSGTRRGSSAFGCKCELNIANELRNS